jgi:hypothetical protein
VGLVVFDAEHGRGEGEGVVAREVDQDGQGQLDEVGRGDAASPATEELAAEGEAGETALPFGVVVVAPGGRWVGDVR